MTTPVTLFYATRAQTTIMWNKRGEVNRYLDSTYFSVLTSHEYSCSLCLVTAAGKWSIISSSRHLPDNNSYVDSGLTVLNAVWTCLKMKIVCPPKRRYLPTSPHCVTTQQTNIDIFTLWEHQLVLVAYGVPEEEGRFLFSRNIAVDGNERGLHLRLDYR